MLIKADRPENYPTVLLRISEKCSSNCSFCTRPSLKDNAFYSEGEIARILQSSKTKIDSCFTLGILGFNVFAHPSFEKIYKELEYCHFSQIVFYISFKEVLSSIGWIKRFTNNRIKFGVQHIVGKEDILEVVKIVNCAVREKIELHLNFIIDLKKYKSFIQVYKDKYSHSSYKNGVMLKVGGVHLEFESNIGLNDIKEFGFHTCVALDNFEIGDQIIYIKNDIELQFNGDIKFHLNNFCNQGIRNISNIFSSDKQIMADFRQLESKLKNKKIGKKMCIDCITSPVSIGKKHSL